MVIIDKAKISLVKGEVYHVEPFQVNDEAKSIHLDVKGNGEFEVRLDVHGPSGEFLWGGGLKSEDRGNARIGAGNVAYARDSTTGKLQAIITRFKNQVGLITLTALTDLQCELSVQNSITIGTPASIDGFSAGLTISVDAGSGSDRLMVGAIAWNNVAATITDFTYNGTSLVAISGATGNNGSQSASLYRQIAPATGAHNLVSTMSTTIDHGIAGIPLSGVDQTTPASGGTGASGSASPVTVNVTSATDDLVIDCFWINHSGGGSTTTVGAGQTARVDRENWDGAHSWGVSTEAGAGTVTMSWTATNASGWGQAAANIKAAGAAAGFGHLLSSQRNRLVVN